MPKRKWKLKKTNEKLVNGETHEGNKEDGEKTQRNTKKNRIGRKQ